MRRLGNSGPGRLRRPLARDDGFTIVEVLVAALIVVISGLAVLAAVDAASRNTFRAQQNQVLNDRLQSEMGKIKQLQYTQIALTSAPAHSTDPASPSYRVSGTQFNITLPQNPPATAVNEPLVYNGRLVLRGLTRLPVSLA